LQLRHDRFIIYLYFLLIYRKEITMDQIATEKHSIKPAKESLADYGDIDQDEGRHPTRVFKKTFLKIRED